MVMLIVVVRAEGGIVFHGWSSRTAISTVMLVPVDDAEPRRDVCTRYMADEALQMPGARRKQWEASDAPDDGTDARHQTPDVATTF